MAKYSVRVPFCGFVVVDVLAESKEEAIEKGVDSDLSMRLTLNESGVDYEWDTHEHIVRGNVFYGNLNSASAELVDDEDGT